MPRVSERKKLLSELYSLLMHLALDGKEASAEFNELLMIEEGISSSRYLSRNSVVPKSDGLRELFWNMSDDQFRQNVRMDKLSFIGLLSLIEDHEVFKNNSRNPQTKTWIQLMVTLNRLGCDGNGAAINRFAVTCGCSYGSVVKFTDRVLKAILSLHDRYVFWPNEEERAAISSRFGEKHGMPGCVGVIDGTPVNFMQRPGVDGEIWFTRKKRYAMNVQLICDDRGFIRFYILGWPGSVFDSTIYTNSSIYLNPSEFFSLLQYLIADAGYQL
eukprot:gene18327-25804_t